MTDSKEDTPPAADVVVKPKQTEHDKVSSLTQVLRVGEQLSKKPKVSHVCEAVERD